MKPVRNYSALVELLDRALDKGVLVAADVIISVAGVPLIGLNLRLGLASMETMLKHGMMTDWNAARQMMQQSMATEKSLNEEGQMGGIIGEK
jgi:hypothetical protein